MNSLVAALGVVLLLGGIGHSIGVSRLYWTSGLPDANRILVDIWVGQAQLLAGGLYLAAFRAKRTAKPWRHLAIFGALTIGGFAVTMLPVLVARAPVVFRIPPAVYLLCSLVVLARARKSEPAEPRRVATR